MTGRFRWLPYDGRRHVVPAALVARDEGEALCGHTVVVPRDPPPKVPDGCWPECPSCDRSWRTREGIPLRPELPTPRPDAPALHRGTS
ncbi:MAG: zinc finger protein [Umezawaea sp.]